MPNISSTPLPGSTRLQTTAPQAGAAAAPVGSTPDNVYRSPGAAVLAPARPRLSRAAVFSGLAKKDSNCEVDAGEPGAPDGYFSTLKIHNKQPRQDRGGQDAETRQKFAEQSGRAAPGDAAKEMHLPVERQPQYQAHADELTRLCRPARHGKDAHRAIIEAVNMVALVADEVAHGTCSARMLPAEVAKVRAQLARAGIGWPDSMEEACRCLAQTSSSSPSPGSPNSCSPDIGLIVPVVISSRRRAASNPVLPLTDQQHSAHAAKPRGEWLHVFSATRKASAA